MKNTYFFILIIISFSCTKIENVFNSPMEKPFIIISKGKPNSESDYKYIYQDKNGIQNYFYEERDKYSIGDTLK